MYIFDNKYEQAGAELCQTQFKLGLRPSCSYQAIQEEKTMIFRVINIVCVCVKLLIWRITKTQNSEQQRLSSACLGYDESIGGGWVGGSLSLFCLSIFCSWVNLRLHKGNQLNMLP